MGPIYEYFLDIYDIIGEMLAVQTYIYSYTYNNLGTLIDLMRLTHTRCKFIDLFIYLSDMIN